MKGGIDLNLNYSKRELAEVWNNLNNWIWDERLGDKPEDWDVMPIKSKTHIRTKRNFVSPIMKKIRNKIGEKECLRHHHIHNLKRSNFQFEIFWLKRKIRRFFGDDF